MAANSEITTAYVVMEGSRSWLCQLRNYFECFVENSSSETLLDMRGPYVVKTELILQIAERKVIQQDRALLTSNRKKAIKKYLVELKKLLIAAYVATISVSKNKFSKEEADTVDKMWLKLTDNLAGMDTAPKVEEVLRDSNHVKYNITRLKKKIEKKTQSKCRDYGDKRDSFVLKKKKSHLVRFVRYLAKNMRILE